MRRKTVLLLTFLVLIIFGGYYQIDENTKEAKVSVEKYIEALDEDKDNKSGFFSM